MENNSNEIEIEIGEPDKKKRKLVVSIKEPAEESVKFDASHFKKLIKGEHPLGAVKQLLAVIKYTNDDSIIDEYLRSGGSALDIVLVLDKLESKSFYHHYQPVFSVLSLVIIKCRDEFPRLALSTEEACRRLLRNHVSVLHAMLSSSSTQVHKKAVLEMLTGMVTLSVELAREVLSALSLREQSVNDLAKHPVKYEPNSTRAHFIRYVLSYFYHNSILLIKQLLDQRHLLQSIILAGLRTDESPLLVVLLSTMQEKIVENTTISKTIKLKIFNTKIMVKLVDAYNWTGPDVHKKKHSKKDVDHMVVAEDREEVIGQLHHLLVTLCTNHKIGVAFVDPSVGLDKENYNTLVFSVVYSMDQYWNNSWVRDLALKILIACPDLVVGVFKHFGIQGFFTPEVSLSFVNTCEFAKQVLENLVAERSLIASGSPDQLTHLTVRAVFNMNVLGCVRASLLSVHPTLRLLAINLLNAMFQTLKRFIAYVKGLFSSNPRNLIDFQQRIADYITKNISLEEELMVSWSLGVGGDQSQLTVPTDTEYFLPLVDLLLSYHQVFPLYLPAVFLTKLQTTCLDTIDSDTKHLFSVKIIKFIIMFKNIQPSQPEFREMVETLVPLLSKWGEAKSVLRDLLLLTGFFDGVECEVDAWVWSLSMFPACEHHLRLCLAALREASCKPRACLKILKEANDVTETPISDQFNWNELTEVAKNPGKVLTPVGKMLPSARLSILVPALTRVLKCEEVYNSCCCKFISHLLGNILFNQVELDTFWQLLDSCTSPLLESIKQYTSRWNNTEEQNTILSHHPFKKHSPEYQVIHALSAENTSQQLHKVVDAVQPSVWPRLVSLVLFHAVRVSDVDMVSRCCSLIHILLSRLEPSHPCLHEVLMHPTVLRLFHPLQPPSSCNLTPLVLTLVEFVTDEHKLLLKPYKQRLIAHIQKAVKKGKKAKNNNLLEIFAKLVTEKEDVVVLLSTIIELQPELCGWADLVSGLLQLAVSHECLLPAEVVAVLSRHTSLHTALVRYLAVFPHMVDHLDIDYLTSRQEELSQVTGLVLRFDSDGSVQRSLVEANKRQPQVLFPALSAVGCHVESSLKRRAAQLTSSVTEALTTEPLPTWLSENSHTVGTFIAQLSDEKCEECYACLSDVESWTCAHLDIARHVYVKLGHEVELVLRALEMLVLLTTATTLDRAQPVCACLREVLKDVNKHGHVWERVLASPHWTKWTRLALQLGETPDSDASFLLTTLSAVCAVVYSPMHRGVSTLQEMVFSHSQFLAVMLAKPSSNKNALLELLLTLFRLDCSAAKSTHVPIYLSAYSASLSTADQLLLQLLQLYESKGISLAEWKPFLWGETAATFYSVRSQVTPGLQNKQNFTLLLDLLDENRVNSTITNFALDRTLQPTAMVKDQPEVYDPAFYLPMLVTMLAPGEIFYTYKACQSGCLSLTLCALASSQEDVRTVAFVALQRFHCNILSNAVNPSHTGIQDTLWLHFLDALRRGLGGAAGAVPRVSSVVAVFLARTVLVLTNPSHPLYKPLSCFILAKPRFSLDAVPELLPLFNSNDIELHQNHQEWILLVLRDGMRESEDFTLCLRSMVFKVIMEYFSSSLASEKSKMLILDTLAAGVDVKFPSGQSAGTLLLDGYSLYPWLHTVVHDPALSASSVCPLVTVLAKLLHTSCAYQIIPLLLHLVTKPQITEHQLTAVLAALVPHSLPVDSVFRLCDVVETAVGGVSHLRTMLDNGVKYMNTNHTESNARGFLTKIICNSLKNEP